MHKRFSAAVLEAPVVGTRNHLIACTKVSVGNLLKYKGWVFMVKYLIIRAILKEDLWEGYKKNFLKHLH